MFSNRAYKRTVHLCSMQIVYLDCANYIRTSGYSKCRIYPANKSRYILITRMIPPITIVSAKSRCWWSWNNYMYAYSDTRYAFCTKYTFIAWGWNDQNDFRDMWNEVFLLLQHLVYLRISSARKTRWKLIITNVINRLDHFTFVINFYQPARYTKIPMIKITIASSHVLLLHSRMQIILIINN